jgi:predicted small secreted protein
MKHLFSFVLMTAFLVSLTGCGVIGGAGQDISSVGHVVTKSANAVKNTLP